jgi:hypothetical protein
VNMVDVDYIPFDTSDMYEFRCLSCNCCFAIYGFWKDDKMRDPKACPACGKTFESEDDYERQVGDL